MVIDNGMAKGKYTPAGSIPLVNNDEGFPASGSFNYSSVVVILLYLSGHTRTYIAFAVNCCARYMFYPKHSHEEALNKIDRNLKMTRECGLILNTNREIFNIDSYPDADSSGVYGHDNPTDPVYVKSHTGCVMIFSYSPVLWQSKLHTETSLLTI